MLTKFKFILPGGFLLLAFSSIAGVFQGKIEDFRLSSCHSQHCFRIISPAAYVSSLDGNYAFDEASVVVQGKSADRTLASRDVYYDLNLKKVFIRNVEGVDFVYDVATGEVNRYGQ